MDQPAPANKKQIRELNPRFRKGQRFYQELTKLIKVARKRPYYTPFIFLIVKHYADRFHLVDYINAKVRWDETQWQVSPGNLALGLIYLMFMTEDGRIPLYKVSERIKDLDLTLLFDDPVHSEDFTIDAYETLLDRLHEAGCQDIFTTIALQVYELFPLRRSYTLHSDTTTHMLYGIYAICEEEAYHALTPAHGHSKDHRPDLKQVKTGLIADGNGIPLNIQTLDGNMSDSTWNTDAIQQLQERIGDQLSLYIYVADSKLVNLKNFQAMTTSTSPLRFISLIPASFYKKTSSYYRDLAYREDAWIELGTCCEHSEAKDRETYAVQEFPEMIEGYPYRILVYRTSRSDKNIEKKLKTEREDLQARAEERFKAPYACEKDALKELNQFLKETRRGKYQPLLEIVPETQVKKLVGRPPKNPLPQEYVTVYRVRVTEIVPINDRVLQFRQGEESFVLITNVTADELDARGVLLRYKGQWKVENLFKRLKKPMLVDTIFLKLPVRIEALIMLAYIALLFQAIMQAMARTRVSSMEILPKIRYAKQSVDNPTYELLVWLFKPFVMISDESSAELTWSGDEAGQYIQFLLYLVDMDSC